MKKKIISFFVILFLLIACVSCEKKNQGIVDGVIDSNNLKIYKFYVVT